MLLSKTDPELRSHASGDESRSARPGGSSSQSSSRTSAQNKPGQRYTGGEKSHKTDQTGVSPRKSPDRSSSPRVWAKGVAKSPAIISASDHTSPEGDITHMMMLGPSGRQEQAEKTSNKHAEVDVYAIPSAEGIPGGSGVASARGPRVDVTSSVGAGGRARLLAGGPGYRQVKAKLPDPQTGRVERNMQFRSTSPSRPVSVVVSVKGCASVNMKATTPRSEKHDLPRSPSTIFNMENENENGERCQER